MKTILLAGATLLIAMWVISGPNLSRRLPSAVQSILSALFIFFVVRVALGFSILAFGLTPLSVGIALLAGLVAWFLRPGKQLSQR